MKKKWRIQMKAIKLIGFILVLFTAWDVSAATARERPVRVGYLAVFKGLDTAIARTRLEDYTHFNLAFANPAPDGRFVVDGRLGCMPDDTGENLTIGAVERTVETLRSHGAKIFLSVGGGTIPACSGDWRSLVGPDHRAATIASLVALAETLELDGIDIDLEGQLLTAIDDAGDYTPFIAGLSAALKARHKLLSCATASYEGGMIPIASIRYFDLVNVMSYDAIGPTWGQPGSEHSSLAGAKRDLDLWLARGVPAERLVLGVPYYGYGFGGERPNWSYRDLVAAYGTDATRADLIGTPCATCRYISFNSPATIEQKAALAREKAGGVMVWELSQDTPDHALSAAILRGLFGK